MLGTFGAILVISVLASSGSDINQFFDIVGSIFKFFAALVLGVFQFFVTIIEVLL